MTKPTVDNASDLSLRAARSLSKALFGGARYRLEIGDAVAQSSIVNTAELAERLGIARQSVNQELRVLERSGLLVRAPEPGREVYFLRQESAYWTWCSEAFAHAVDMLNRTPPY